MLTIMFKVKQLLQGIYLEGGSLSALCFGYYLFMVSY